MSRIVEKFAHKMAENLEFRSRYPSTDVWPSPLANIHLATDITGDYILDSLAELFSKSFPIESMSKSFYRPSRLVNLMYLFFVAPKTEIIARRRSWLAEKMLECISFLRCGDTFIEKGENKIRDFESSLSTYNFDTIDNDCKAVLRKILVALAVINEYLYFAWAGVGRENHGLYHTNRGNILVREYYDMKPSFWSFTDESSYSQCVVLTNARESFTPIFDFNGRMYFNGNGDFTRASLILDGVECEHSVAKMTEVYKSLQAVIAKAKNEVKRMSGNELLLKAGQMQYHAFIESAKRMNVSFPDELPNAIQQSLLNASGQPSGVLMTQKLSNTTDRESRIRIIQDFIMPSNMGKYC